jgi:hypothetical protein
VDGREKLGHDEEVELEGGTGEIPAKSGAIRGFDRWLDSRNRRSSDKGLAKGVQRVAPERVEHGNVWGFGGLPLDFLRLSSHIGAAARKRGEHWERRRFPPRSRWEIGQFRAFAIREEMDLTGGCASALRTSFCVLKV